MWTPPNVQPDAKLPVAVVSDSVLGRMREELTMLSVDPWRCVDASMMLLLFSHRSSLSGGFEVGSSVLYVFIAPLIDLI